MIVRKTTTIKRRLNVFHVDFYGLNLFILKEGKCVGNIYHFKKYSSSFYQKNN